MTTLLEVHNGVTEEDPPEIAERLNADTLSTFKPATKMTLSCRSTGTLEAADCDAVEMFHSRVPEDALSW